MEDHQVHNGWNSAAESKESTAKLASFVETSSATSDSEKRRKQAETRLIELTSRFDDLNRIHNESNEMLKKIQKEHSDVKVHLADTDRKANGLAKQVASLQKQLADSADSLQEEIRAKGNLQTKLRLLEDECSKLKLEREENEDVKLSTERRNHLLQQQLADLRQQADDKISSEFFDEMRKKLAKDNATLRKRVQDAEFNRERAERLKFGLQSEIESLMNEVESLRETTRAFEIKQKNLEQLVEEQRAVNAKVTLDRDAHSELARVNEIKLLSVVKELELATMKFAESDKARRELQAELEEWISSKDDSGKNVVELERTRRELETKLSDCKHQKEELEDAVQLSDDARRRLEVECQSLRADSIKAMLAKEDAVQENRRVLLRQINDLEIEVENERRKQATMTMAKNKLDIQVEDLENQLEIANTSLKQSRMLSRQLKEMEREAEEVRKSLQEKTLALQDSENRRQFYESQLITKQDELENILASCRRAEAERDELFEQLNDMNKGSLTNDKKKSYEDEIRKLRDDLNEEQSHAEIACDKYRRVQAQIEQLTGDLSFERSVAQKIEIDRKAVENQNNELKRKIGDLESALKLRDRAQLTAMNAKIENLEEQLRDKEKEHNSVCRNLRRIEKLYADLTAVVNDEPQLFTQMKIELDESKNQCDLLKRKAEKLEDEEIRLKSELRRHRRELDDLNDIKDTLMRENAVLRNRNNFGGTPRLFAVQRNGLDFHRGSGERLNLTDGSLTSHEAEEESAHHENDENENAIDETGRQTSVSSD